MNTVFNFTEYKIIQNDNRKYIYCVIDNKILEIDDKTIELLNQNGKTYEEIKKNLIPLFREDELDELIKSMDELGLLENKNHNFVNRSDQSLGNITTLILLVAQDCNLRCSYCYADEGKYYDSGKMDFNTAKKSIDFLIEKTVSDKVSICFFGGEPLLNFELIKKIVAYCHKKEKEIGKKFAFSMTTNGTLINKEIEEFIINNHIIVQISIDGDRKTHDANRYYSGKLGSYETVYEKTKSLREKRLLDARGTVTTAELNLVHIYDFLQSIEFNNIALSPALNLLTDEEYGMVANAYINLNLNCEKLIKEKKYEEVKNNGMFMNQLSDIHRANIRTRACGAGNNMYAIDINGDIYPCQRFVGNKKTSLGNVFESDHLQKKYLEETTITNFEKCTTCWIRNLCVGGCVYDNISITENMNIPYEPFCKYKEKIVTELIKIYLRLSDDELYEFFKD